MQRRNRTALIVILILASTATFLVRSRSRVIRPEQRASSRPQRVQGPTSATAVPEKARPLQLVPASVRSGQSARIEGQVVTRGSDRGIPDAEITFEHLGRAISVKTDSRGFFSYEPNEEGTFTLAAITAAGHLPFAPAWGNSPVVLNIGHDTNVRDLRFSLNPAVEYTARVFDPDGKPMPRADVKIWADADQILYPIPENFVTDANGECRFSASEGTLVQASHPKYSHARARIDFRVQITRQITLRLRQLSEGDADKPKVISGFVIDEQERPILAAQVIARSSDSFAESALHPGGSAETDSSGAFRILELDPGRYQLTASAEGYASVLKAGVPSGTEGFRIHLKRGSRIRGRVRDADSKRPIASFAVAAFHRWGPLQRTFALEKSFIDANGQFDLGPLTPGTYSLIAGAPGHSTAEVAVELPSGADVTADFLLEGGGTIFGIVLDESSHRPISGAHIRLDAGNSLSLLLVSCDSDSAGKFELRDVPLGLRSIQALAQGYHARIVSGLQATRKEALGPIKIELTPLREGEEPKVELAGIGVVLAAQGEVLILGRVVAGGGAAEVGLTEGDAILEIDGAPVPSLGFEGSINKIRGPENSEVLLKVRKQNDGNVAVLRVPRRRVRG